MVLEGKVALVTGAAGTMGRAAVKFLLEDGCNRALAHQIFSTTERRSIAVLI